VPPSSLWKAAASSYEIYGGPPRHHPRLSSAHELTVNRASTPFTPCGRTAFGRKNSVKGGWEPSALHGLHRCIPLGEFSQVNCPGLSETRYKQDTTLKRCTRQLMTGRNGILSSPLWSSSASKRLSRCQNQGFPSGRTPFPELPGDSCPLMSKIARRSHSKRTLCPVTLKQTIGSTK